MNRSFLFIILLCFFSASVYAEDIAYIVKDTSRLNHDFLNAVNDLGLTVRVIDDDNINSFNLSSFKMLLVGNDRFSNPSSIPVNDYPTLMSNQYYVSDWYWASDISSVSSSQPLQARNVYQNQITKGLQGVIQVYDDCCYNGVSVPMYYLAKEKRPLNLRSVTSTMSDSNDAVVSTSTKGTVLRSGRVSNAKGVFFGIMESTKWTQETETLFKNSVLWLINEPPKLNTTIPDKSLDEDSSLVGAYDLSTYFSDRENDPVTYSVIGNSHVKANISGSIVTLYADPNWFGSENVRFVATEADQKTESNFVKITVNSVNDIPVIPQLPDVTVVETEYVDVNATATDADGDTTSISYSAPLNSLGNWQTSIGDAGIYTVTVTADDSRGGKDSKAFKLTVLPKVYVNEFSLEGWVELYNPQQYDIDLGSWLLSSSSSSLPLSSTVKAKDFLVMNLNLLPNDQVLLKKDGYVIDSAAFGSFNDGNSADNSQSPPVPKSAARKSDGYDSGSDKLDFVVLDRNTKGLSNTADVTPPAVSLINPADGFVLTAFSRQASLTFSASDNRASDLACDLFTDSSGSFDVVASTTVRSGNQGSFTLSGLQDRSYVWNVRCFDSRNYAFAASNRTLVVDVNDPPEITSYAPENLSPEVYENSPLIFSHSSVDPEGNPLTYSWKVNGVELASTKDFTYTPGFFDAGNKLVRLAVADSGNLTSTQEWNVKVINVNRKPYPVLQVPLQNFDEDKMGSLTLTDYFADDDRESLSYKVVDEDVNKVDCDIGLSKLYMTPARNFNGEASCVIVSSDGIEDSENVTVSILVNPVNDAPQLFDDIPAQSWDEDSSVTDMNLSDYFYDVDSAVIDYSVSGNSNITVAIAGSMVSFSQPQDWYGTEYVKFSASDGNLTTQSGSVRLNVRNVNDAPSALPMPEQVLDEDSNSTLDLTPYFEDREGSGLSYSVKDKDASKVDCVISRSVLSIKPSPDFFGNASCSIVASDGSDDSLPNVVGIVVSPVNDAPVFKNEISSYAWDEDTSLSDAFDLNDYFLDVDGGALIITFSGNANINVAVTGSNVSFSQPADWFGSETITFTASDSVSSVSSNSVVLTVNNVNELPFLYDVPEQAVLEDSTFNHVFLNATDVDGSIDSFYVKEEDTSRVDCEVSGSTLKLFPAKDFVGNASCTIVVRDNSGGEDSVIVLIQVDNVNDAPVLDSSSPDDDSLLITEDGSQQFSVSYHDIDPVTSPVSVTWYVNDVLSGSGDSFTYNASGSGSFSIKAVVSDSEFSSEKSWSLVATACPITNVFDGSTTKFCDLSPEELESLDCVVLEKTGFGKIDFCGSKIDLSDVVYLDKYLDIGQGFVAFNTQALPVFANKKAKITFYNIASEVTPQIYYGNAFVLDPKLVNSPCPSSVCSNVSFDGSTLEFVVSQFSTFRAGSSKAEPAKTCAELGGFVCSSGDVCAASWLGASDTSSCCSVACASPNQDSDNNVNETFNNLDTCKAGVVGNVDVEVKEPDSGDDFRPGSSIDVEVKVRNSNDKDLDMRVKAVLYNKDDEDELESDSDDVDVDEHDSETLTLTLEVPDDVDDGDDIIVFVKAFEDGSEDEQCNEDKVGIDVKREKHDVSIEKLRLTPTSLSCDRSFSLSFTADNIGKSDESLHFTVSQSALGVDFESEQFDLDEGDSISRSVSFELPDEVSQGSYPVDVTLYFGDGSEFATALVNVLDCVREGIAREGIPLGAGTPDLGKMSLLESSFSVKPGSYVTIPVLVTNLGSETADFKLAVSGISSYADLIEAEKLSLKPGQSSTAYIYIKTRGDSPAGLNSASIALESGGLTVDSGTASIVLSGQGKAVFIPGVSTGVLVLLFITAIIVIVVIFAAVWYFYKPRPRRRYL